MISIKNRPSSPASLNSRQVREIKQRIADIVNNRGSISSNDFSSGYWREIDVRNTLWDSQNGSAAFARTNVPEKGNSMPNIFDRRRRLRKNQIIQDIGGLLMSGTIYYTLVSHVTKSIKKIIFPF